MALLLLGIFLVITLVCILYYLAFLSFAASREEKPGASGGAPVSVIICAKNEADNLREFLPGILNQEYPEFELILINDASTDQTPEVMEEFQKKDSRIKLVNVRNTEAFWANKKYALTLGIKKASHPLLLFTDADCVPQSPHWIAGMAGQFREKKSIVLGYGGYFMEKGSFLNKLIRFETFLTALQYFSFAKLRIPYMGVGRNLAYTADEFYRHNGFAGHLQIRSGDDDLFVNEAATGENTAICAAPEAFTRSVPKKRLGEWFLQKRRHTSIAHHYKFRHQMLLGLFFVARLSFWLLLPLLLIMGPYRWVSLSALTLLLIIQFIVYLKAAKKLQEPGLVWLFPVLEIFLIFSQLGIFIANLFSKPPLWK